MDEKIKKMKILLVFGFMALILLIVATFAVAYARYSTKTQGTATAQIAKIVCNMTVQRSGNTSDVINPYCTLTVKDYEGTSITETDIRYTIEVEATDGIELPAYVWKDTNGTILARNTSLPYHYFTNGVSDDHVFVIEFLNSGEVDITRYVDFHLKAVQVMPQ